MICWIRLGSTEGLELDRLPPLLDPDPELLFIRVLQAVTAAIIAAIA